MGVRLEWMGATESYDRKQRERRRERENERRRD
jgi:hypothetical protein